jgi:hypothetical protein
LQILLANDLSAEISATVLVIDFEVKAYIITAVNHLNLLLDYRLAFRCVLI